MAFSGSQLTRLGLSGVPRQVYGSFGGKASPGAYADLWFTLSNERTEFTLAKAPDITLEDNRTEFTLENP